MMHEPVPHLIFKLIQNFGAPSAGSTQVEVYRLRHLRNVEDCSFEAVDPQQCDPDKTPLLFIHGIEYASPREVIRDLVYPFLAYSGLLRDSTMAQYEILFVSWDSQLICPDNHASLYELRQRLNLPLCSLLALNYWGQFVKSVEHRAKDVSFHIEGYARELWQGRFAPRVVTHSMGSYVWADLVQRMSQQQGLPERMGSWFNLQPAIPNGAFCAGGEFDAVVDAYAKEGSTNEIWYSRLDMVLSSFYYMATKDIAMGLVGSPQRHRVPHVDMTWVGGEAHGAINLNPSRGCFLRRAGKRIRQRFNLAPICE